MTPVRLVSMLTCAGLVVAGASAWGKASSNEVQSFQQAKVSALEAVATAETASGGKAMDVKFGTDNRAPIFDVTILNAADNATKHYIVNAAAMPAAAKQKQGVVAKVEGEQQSERAAAKVAKVSLKDAITKAETNTGGKAINADLELHGSTAGYDIEILQNGATMMYTVDAGSGAVTPSK